MLPAIAVTVPIGTPHPDPCPDCLEKGITARLLLTVTPAGIGYICENKYRTGCQGNAGAHEETGKPKGIAHTRDERMLCTICHDLFDPLWKQHRGSKAIEVRTEMYKVMQEEMANAGMLAGDKEFHFASLTGPQLSFALRIIQTKIKRRFG